MTRKVMLYAKCRVCGADAVCSECGGKIERFSPFSDWLRSLPAPLDSSRISNQNLDFVWHNYRDNWFITMEEKQYGAKCKPAQWDTHGIVYQFLDLASAVLEKAQGRVRAGVNSNRNLRRVEYRGHYVISLENTTPDDSEWIRINKSERTQSDLMHLLMTGGLPEQSQLEVTP